MSEYGRRDKSGHWHTNTVENLFATFKRGIVGNRLTYRRPHAFAA